MDLASCHPSISPIYTSTTEADLEKDTSSRFHAGNAPCRQVVPYSGASKMPKVLAIGSKFCVLQWELCPSVGFCLPGYGCLLLTSTIRTAVTCALPDTTGRWTRMQVRFVWWGSNSGLLCVRTCPSTCAPHLHVMTDMVFSLTETRRIYREQTMMNWQVTKLEAGTEKLWFCRADTGKRLASVLFVTFHLIYIMPDKKRSSDRIRLGYTTYAELRFSFVVF
jgi:hypothetical protein